MKIKLSSNLIIQVLATIGQGVNQVSGLLPPKWQPIAALGLGSLQLATAWISHFSNPDGTSAAVAYKP